MLKSLSEIWSIVKGLPVLTQTIFIFCVLFLTAGYFFYDRYLDHQEANPNNTEWLKEWKKNKEDINVQLAGGTK